MLLRALKNIGPGALITAAFIGPGTLTVCTIAGVNFGYEILWALLISIVATIVLQEMAARLGVVTQKGLTTAVREELTNPLFRFFALALIVSAIIIGNAAYEAGNISGSVLGLSTLISETNIINEKDIPFNLISLFVGIIAFLILYIGSYKFLEKLLTLLVILMSIAFITTAVLTKPDWLALVKGMFRVNINSENLLTVMALVGTTVVPYNLFLHSSLVSQRWKSAADLAEVRTDAYVSIIFGGLVSMAIVVCASEVQNSNINNAADLALGLEPLLGSYAKYFLALGLFAAGITSAIAAPLAAAYVACGCMGWSTEMRSFKFRLVWMFILLVGVLISSLNIKLIDIINFAQIANGMLLPVIAIFLVWIMNKKNVLGEFVNTKFQNVLGVLIILFTMFLGAKSLVTVWAKVFA